MAMGTEIVVLMGFNGERFILKAPSVSVFWQDT